VVIFINCTCGDTWQSKAEEHGAGCLVYDIGVGLSIRRRVAS